MSGASGDSQLFQNRFGKVCSNGHRQVGTSQVGTSQVGPGQVGTAQVGTGQISANQVSTGQISSTQVSTGQGGIERTNHQEVDHCPGDLFDSLKRPT